MTKPELIMKKSHPILKRLFIKKCKQLIDKYENSSVFQGRVSSKTLLIHIIKSSYTYKYALRSLNSYKLDLQCHLLLEDIIWYELHKEKYYLPDGGFDLYKYGASMRGIHNECLFWLLHNKQITQTELDNKVYERDCYNHLKSVS